MSVASYNTNPALNTAISGIDISENSAAAGYNNALRQMMADIKDWTNTYAVTYPISVANGGTGATTAAAALSNLGGLNEAFRGLPQISRSGAFDTDTSMSGGHIRYTGGASTFTIRLVSAIAMPVSCVVLVINDGTGALAIAREATVALIWAANGADANRSLAVGGMATLIQVATNRWFISGTGLS